MLLPEATVDTQIEWVQGSMINLRKLKFKWNGNLGHYGKAIKIER